MRKNIHGCLIGVVCAVFSMSAMAAGLPLSCTTVNTKGGGFNYKVDAITGGVGEFPLSVACPDDATRQCSDFGYIVTSLSGASVSHTLFATAADYVIEDDPSASEDIYAPGAGSPDGFLGYVTHEKAVRFNSNATTFEAHIYVEGDVEAGATTAYIQGGKNDESCAIAGAGSLGTLGDIWQPTTSEKNVNVLHGECDATLHYNGKGDLVNITVPAGSACFTGKVPPGAKALLGDEIIQNANIPDGISFGEQSTIMYLPSGWAICTASPCPGTTTYKFIY